MDNLQIIDLFDNDFTGSVADDMANMDQLLVLGLGDNDIDGQLPTSLPPKLQFLELSDNDFFGNIPGDAIGALSDLESLALSDNARLVGPIPHHVRQSQPPPPRIGRLQPFGRNSPRDRPGLPAELTTLSRLERLHLHNNGALGGAIPENIGDLTALRELFLYSSGLTGEIPQSLGDL